MLNSSDQSHDNFHSKDGKKFSPQDNSKQAAKIHLLGVEERNKWVFFSIEKTHLHSHINNLLNNLAPIFCVIAPFKHVRGSKACCGIIFLALNLLKVLCFYLICNTILFVFHLCKVICTELNNLFSFKYFYLKFLCNKTNSMCISSLMTV